MVFIRTSGFEKSNVSNFASGFCSNFGFHCLWHATMYETQQFRLTSIVAILDFLMEHVLNFALRIKWYALECAEIRQSYVEDLVLSS